MSGDQPDARPFAGSSGTSRGGLPAPVPGAIDTSDRYNMNHKDRGIAVIINNDTFDPRTRMGPRTGSALDRDELGRMFSMLGFKDIRVYNNMEYRKMIRLMEDVADEDFTERDCFACAILSHGEQDFVYGVDDKVSLESLYKPFRGNLAKTLAGKPKLFILQACRGEKLDEGVIVSDALPSKATELPRTYRIASESDFLMAFSVVPGYYSWRNCRNGSWFVQSFCQVMMEYGKRTDFLRCLTMVNKKVSYTYQSNAASVEMTDKKQSPCIMSMLTKELYF